jgi:phage terminase large subunit GpA-like protein
VAEAAEKYVKLNNPGAYVGPYQSSQTPYMIEPQNVMASRDFEGVVFVSSAQSGKTQALILNFLAYTALVDPMDIAIFSPTQGAARDFSIRRVDRMNRLCPELANAILPDRDADNVFDKRYKSGIILSLAHPTVTQFAGRPMGRILLTDYDRMDDDIGGDGSPYDLASKRTTTFGSFAMTLAESSPSRPLTTNRWIRTSPHEAPPTTGVLALYNRGDRRRFYWRCLHCSHRFEGTFRNLKWDQTAPSSLAAGKTVRLICPSCNESMQPDDRRQLNAEGVWLKDGQTINEAGEVVGEARESRIASFWLNGIAAAFITWQKLVALYLDAETEYTKTGSEDALKKFYNNDLGEAYLKKVAEIERLPEVLKSRAVRMPEREVPPNVRFLIATIDVQANMWIVQVYGVMPGRPFDLAIVDRFDIRKSKRVDSENDVVWVKPHVHLEDWNLITEQVIQKTYPLSDGSGRSMMIKLVGCDSGGKAGATTRAYEYWRHLRTNGYGGRFQLIKGEGGSGRPRTTIDYPDNNRKDRFAAARGDVPVMFLNSNLLKDDLLGRLDVTEPGSGMIHMPDWLPNEFFAEMCAETRKAGGWEKQRRRNEAWDLTYYALALCVSPLIRIDTIDWSNPVAWAGPWDINPLVLDPTEKERFAPKPPVQYDTAALAKLLA